MERQQTELAARMDAEKRLQSLTFTRQFQPMEPENTEPFPAIVAAQ